MKYCYACGKQIADDADFCIYCGKKTIDDLRLINMVQSQDRMVNANPNGIPNGELLNELRPLDDGGDKFNKIYIILPAILAVCMLLVFGNVMGLFLGIPWGILFGWGIKNAFMRYEVRKLRYRKFAILGTVDVNMISNNLYRYLSPYGISVERYTNGNLQIKYRKVYYDINFYLKEGFFSIWWRKSIADALLMTRNEYITLNRRSALITGVAAYIVQKSCVGVNSSSDIMINQKLAEIMKKQEKQESKYRAMHGVLIGISVVCALALGVFSIIKEIL